MYASTEVEAKTRKYTLNGCSMSQANFHTTLNKEETKALKPEKWKVQKLEKNNTLFKKY